MILSAFSVFNAQLMLHSGIGQPYDPVSTNGTIGRNFTHQTISSVNGFFDNKKYNFNPFIASGSIGVCIDEFNGDNFDHGPLGFVRRGVCRTGPDRSTADRERSYATGHAQMGCGLEAVSEG